MRKTIFSFILSFVITQSFCQINLMEGFVSQVITNELNQPTDLVIAEDGRVFITEKAGSIRVIEDGILLEESVYEVQTQTPNERGLTSLVLDPNFEENGYMYIYYALTDEIKNKVTRIKLIGNTAIIGSETTLFVSDQGVAGWHNGGGIVFDTDGKLLLATGNNTIRNASARLDNTLGKIIRINTDGSIPSDNPFYNITEGNDKTIYAYGLRNPYTMAISKRTGRIFVNDVGSSSWEEINEVFRGKNYGWDLVEGFNTENLLVDSNYLDPVFAYDHDFGCAVVGAGFYEPDNINFPLEFEDKYFFLDNCNTKLYYMDLETYEVNEFASGFFFANNLEVSSSGTLYVIEIASGKLIAIDFLGTGQAPFFNLQPVDKTVSLGEAITFESNAVGDNVNYQWYMNEEIIVDAVSNKLNLNSVTSDLNGANFFVIAQNDVGEATSDTVTISVINGHRPSVQIQTNIETYSGGDTLEFEAIIDDQDQTVFTNSQVEWEISFYHDEHSHPALSSVFGEDGLSYVIDRNIETDTNVFYRIKVLVTDNSGLNTLISKDILPKKVSTKVSTIPDGLEVRVDGKKYSSGEYFRSVENVVHSLQSPAHQVFNDTLYAFVSWNNGEVLENIFVEGIADTNYISIYEAKNRFVENNDFSTAFAYTFEGTGNNKEEVGTLDDLQEISGNWDNISPVGLPHDGFSIEYSGSIHAPISGEYTFYLRHDGLANLVIGQDTLIKEKISQTGFQNIDTVSIYLEEGTKYNLNLLYEHFNGISRVELHWSYSVVETHLTPIHSSKSVPVLIEDFQNETKTTLFPTITSGLIKIQSDQEVELIEVFDQYGLKQFSVDIFENEIDLSFLKSGIYFVKVKFMNNESFTQKIVRE